VLDECQTTKNDTSKVSAAMASYKSVRRWCLSGTPVQNRPFELHSYYRFLQYVPFSSHRILTDLVANAGKGDSMSMRLIGHSFAHISLRRTKGIVYKPRALPALTTILMFRVSLFLHLLHSCCTADILDLPPKKEHPCTVKFPDGPLKKDYEALCELSLEAFEVGYMTHHAPRHLHFLAMLSSINMHQSKILTFIFGHNNRHTGLRMERRLMAQCWVNSRGCGSWPCTQICLAIEPGRLWKLPQKRA